MKKLFFLTLVIGFFAIGQATAQVVVAVKPVRPAVVVVKPVKARKGYVWVDGHWKYNQRKARYIWVKGTWHKAKRNHRYVAGRWVNTRGGYKWVPGHWRRA